MGLLNKITDTIGLTDTGAARDAAAQGRDYMNQVLKRLDAINLPDEEKMRIALESPELVGLLTAEQLGPSAMEGIQLDPRLQQAQMEALSYLKEKGQAPIGEEERIQFDQFRRKAAGDEQARQASILQGMAQRGNLDSGAQLAAQLSSSQASTNRAAEEGDRLALAAIQAKRQAIGDRANLAGNISQQQFGQKSQIASAKDIIDRFNTQNRQSIQGANLAARQSIADRGVDTRNQQQMYNAGLEQQRFLNEMSKAGATTGAMQNLANQKFGESQAIQSANAAMTGAFIQGGATYMGAKSDKNVKENIKKVDFKGIEGDLKNLLDKLESYQYNYKDEDKSEKNIGVMAQDLEKSPLGKKFVKEVDGVKMVDYGKMAGTQLAAIANINKRLSKIEDKKK